MFIEVTDTNKENVAVNAKFIVKVVSSILSPNARIFLNDNVVIVCKESYDNIRDKIFSDGSGKFVEVEAEYANIILNVDYIIKFEKFYFQSNITRVVVASDDQPVIPVLGTFEEVRNLIYKAL